MDLHEKFRAYRRVGKLRSAVFPGLVLDVKSLLKLDRRKVIATLGKDGF